MTSKQKTILLLSIAALTIPLITNGAVFENPVPANLTISILIARIIYYILGLVGLLALLSIIYGGAMIIIGGIKSEQDLKRGKEIIFWALAGLMIIGMAALIVSIVADRLFVS